MDSSDSDQENNNNPNISPQWNTTQKRKMYYRELLNKVEDIEESADVGIDTAREIGEIIQQVNAIEIEHNIKERYQYPDETILDSMVLSSASGVLVKCIESVDINSYVYAPTEFTGKIVSYCANGEEFETNNLIKLLPFAQHIIPQAPKYNYLFGTYDLQNLPKPKQKKERQKQQKDKFEKKQPEKITNLQKEEKGIDEIVTLLYDVLTKCYEKNGEQAIKYYDYVIDTSSFSNTVENMFYTSFLVRDGRAHLDLDNGVPYIKPMKKRQLKEFRENGGVNSQIISVISIPEWETFKKAGYIQKYSNKGQ